MDWQELLKLIFGDDVSISSILAPICAILVPILTVFFNKVKNKLISVETASTTKDKQIAEQAQKIESLEKSVSYLGNIISVAYLSSNTIPAETKKVIGSYADKLDKVAGIQLSKDAEKLITQVATFVPNVNDKKEEILKATQKAEEVIDTVNDATQAAIDKLKI